MVRFVEIEIENFFSISHIKLPLKSGIYTLLGKNGAGKTSILMAFMQGLYNKNLKTQSLNVDDTYNKVTNKPYRIKITFEINDDVYLIDNYRAKNNIFIFKNGVDITPKGIKNQLKLIERLIGLDYKLFTTFFYLSQNTIKSVFDLGNEDNLVFKFFDIETLNLTDSVLKDEINSLKSIITTNNRIIENIEKQLSILKVFRNEDINLLLLEKEEILSLLNNIETDVKYKKIDLIKVELEKLKEQKIKLEIIKSDLLGQLKILKKQYEQFKKGVCPVCGQSVNKVFDKHEIENIQSEIKSIDSKINNMKDKFDILKEKYMNLKKEKEKLLNEYNNKLVEINSKILSYKELQEKFEKVSKQKDSLEQEKEMLRLSNEEKEKVISVLTISRGIIKSKVLLKDYLNNFIKLVNNKIKELSISINFKFDIFVVEEKNKLKFRIYKDDELLQLDHLSSGEKTRASIIVLFSMLETLQLLSGIKLNILALDEILGVLDKDGVNILKKILDRYRNDITIFLIQHHKEIEDKYFDGVIKLNKINGLTILEEV